MVFRCNLDGSDFETLAWNFRNNYEVAVDSLRHALAIGQRRRRQQGRADQLRDGVRQLRLRRRNDRRRLADAWKKAQAQGRTGRLEGLLRLAPERSRRRAQPAADRRRLADGHLRLRRRTAARRFSAIRSFTATPGRTSCALIPCRPTAPATRRRSRISSPARDKWFRPSDVCVAPDGSLLRRRLVRRRAWAATTWRIKNWRP